jgi:acyl-CoA reductase-like NAD-dependent aldehyde dehydrogenase
VAVQTAAETPSTRTILKQAVPGRSGMTLRSRRRDVASYSPTLIDRVKGEMEMVKQETFGPVSPVLTFKDVDDAVAQVNSTAHGLSSGGCAPTGCPTSRVSCASSTSATKTYSLPW